ncbi:DNA-(apurinic or apyrimidinic site) endonuclease [Tripterygium wilfordii]|uniref:DNA-(apurinic or apyrimidinic site) endonuclease n=1 Tax=Tripterygium wilfordii TaxID=458696 RepID=UPI0018F81D41|nr:DNA-(apurinic or apyrimidinic site) endonuclease [Tripterygium wilfordii]
MKRFFKPIEKEGSAKKAAVSSSKEQDDDNTQIPEEENTKTKKREPLKFVTWNANSLLLRAKSDWPQFSKFVSDLDPDVIAIQEVRMPAAGSKGAPKNSGDIKDDTSSSREEKRILMHALLSPPFGSYQVWWSLADSKYAGTALLVKKCFQPKKVSFSLDRKASKHEPDGRVVLAEFETFDLLNTYAPNNGWKEEENSFQRRRKWDKRIMEFVLQSSSKPLIWCGDLNVSHEEIDVSHPEFFSAAKLNGYVPPNKEDCGQPGFTLAERKRFGAILKEGKLIDAYRFLHKEKDMDHGFSWSGHPIGKYRGKRMRIDYFIVAEELKNRIVRCEMHGHGIELEGFYGSDHCPVSLELLPATPDSKES